LSQFLSQCLSLPLPVIARIAEIASLCPKAIGLFVERHVLGFPALSTCEKMLGEDSQWSLRDPPDNNLILIRDFPFWFSDVRQMG
jgi:hypothetical protein